MASRKITPVAPAVLRGQRQESLEGPWRVDGLRRPESARRGWYLVYAPGLDTVSVLGPFRRAEDAVRLCAQFNALAAERKRGTRA